ncbi:MAG: hypothetical protein ACYSSI_10455, partial [Planctomycetota bacterium]
MLEINKESIKVIYVIAWPILGFLGFLYGFAKDKKLRQIKKRANAPFFTILKIQHDAKAYSRQEGVEPSYIYRREPSDLSAQNLLDSPGPEPKFPDDYPDNYPIG